MARLTIVAGVGSVLLLVAIPTAASPTPQQAPAPAFVATQDKDGDGYQAWEEDAIFGTTGRDRIRCGSDAWPSDVYSPYGQDPDTQNRITVQDLTSFVAPVRRLDTNPGDPNFNRRWNLYPTANGSFHSINVADLVAAFANRSTGASPPMFSGEHALNGRYCSAGVPFFKKATSDFDPFAKDPDAWAGPSNARYRGMLMYPPASDKLHTWYRGEDPNEGFFYRNAGGIEVGDSQVPGVSSAQALRDASGNLCYLPYPSEGPFSRYLADVGSQAYRNLLTNYIVSKTRDYPQYIGPYLDDVDLRAAYASCGDEYPDGNNSSPIDPRTGQVMTSDNWQTYWVGLLQQIRNALPAGSKIVHNSPWYFLPTSDPEHAAQVRAADYVEMEFGWNELDGVGGQYGWNAKMAYVDWVHSLGTHVISQEYQGSQPFTDQQMRYGLANYFLFTDGKDFFSTFQDSDPGNDWTLYGSTLGAPRGARYQTGPVWRRDFQYGYVTVDPAFKIGAIVAP